MTWAATEAKAKFSEVLDRATTSGPQFVTRRKREFVVLTKEEFTRRRKSEAAEPGKAPVSAWEALRPSFDERYEIEFTRAKGKARTVDLG